MLAFMFFGAKVNAQKITLSTLEQLASSGEAYFDSTILTLGFDEHGKYAKGKDTAEIESDSYQITFLDFSTNNAALYDLIKADATKSGYTPQKESETGRHNTDFSGNFRKKHYTLYYKNPSSSIDHKYNISIEYDAR